jgi:hypothetical protein
MDYDYDVDGKAGYDARLAEPFGEIWHPPTGAERV